MATLLPTSQSTSVEAYEDMFKEITRKLYGEESAHGLYPHNTQVAQLAPGTPIIPEGEQRSFTTLVSDRSLAQLEYENAIDNTFKTEDHLSTAFGLAALMQNGFPPPGAILNPVNFNVGTTNSNKQSNNTVNNLLLGGTEDSKLKSAANISAFAGIATSNNDDRWASTDELLASWNPSKISNYSNNQKTNIFKPVKPKQEPPSTVTDTSLIQNITNSIMNSSSNNQQNLTKNLTSQVTVPSLTQPVTKRYSCSSCPYSTDRRDLFTRHENIHKEEKPFHCYACLKQFNRADHVKKHFLRMHRDITYDINKTRKTPAKNNFYATSNQTTTQNQNQMNIVQPQQQQQQQIAQQITGQLLQQQQQQNQLPIIQTSSNTTTLNIPSSFTSVAQNIQLNAINNLQSTIAQQSLQQNVVNTLNGLAVVQQQQQNQQQTQQQQNILPNNIVIKQEKIEKSPPKKKSEKRFMCCYCSWSGADNWGLKRHLNTHTKPFVCLLCDYKAARSERLATHVFKVHNKKACNKCTFFADDQNQLIAHQIEAHPNDSRSSQRQNNSNVNQLISTINLNNVSNVTNNVNTNATTTNNINSNINGGTNTNNNHNNTNISSNNATGNVLRTLQNTFVPNVSNALNAVSSNVSTGNNVFGSINSSILSNSTIYTSNSVNNTTNILNNLNQHLNNTTASNNNANNWRLNANNIISVTLATTANSSNTTTTNTNSSGSNNNVSVTTQSTRQKHGAERLFAYFEADGSDPEDYNRQLAMQSLNRNKSSVAQDFHKAGGQFGNLFTKLQQQSQHQFESNNDQEVEENQHEIDNNSINYYNTMNNNQYTNKMNLDKEKATSCSPPAVPLSNNQSKRRRTTSNNDKENFASPTKSISNVFDKLYQKSIANFMQQISREPNNDPATNYRVMEFLENNPDLTISRVKSCKRPSPEFSPENKRHNRKQLQPRKIDKVEKLDETFSIENLRDKYLNQLVSDTGLKCLECSKDKTCTYNFSYQSKAALVFHRLWRHSEKKIRCKKCRMKFVKRYQLKLHVMFKHKNDEKKVKRGRPKGKKGKTVKNQKGKGGKTGKKRRRRRRY